ncbi:hypothetical protein CTAYLR_009303 [Chrysophaeum taylorii]|uniref:Phytanoyl-CoA dioxygenase n=1 Tax=Chrysophaeum taylorii TaxID=2483200 RepID=A0AAD7UJK0_9STRA|nr:hypothetical protein CTAYLR_009303 [Chrysophaeum taylorii]
MATSSSFRECLESGILPDWSDILGPSSTSCRVASLSAGVRKIAAEKLSREGYVQLPSGIAPATRERLARSVARLLKLGWPPTFVMVLDEVWELYEGFGTWLPRLCLTGDFLAWYVEPGTKRRFGCRAGFSPHRDRVDPAAFFPDGGPKYATVWLAVTPATPENSCLYAIPAHADPGYRKGDGDQDPLRRALPTKESFQVVRCLAARPGDCNVFSHRLLHWGSEGSELPTMRRLGVGKGGTLEFLRRNKRAPPRIALSFVFSDPSFERPYVAGKPDVETRVALAAAQMLCYQDRWQLSKAEAVFFWRLASRRPEVFDPGYFRDKVRAEFVASALRSEGVAGSSNDDDDDDDDDAEEAALEAMLDGEAESSSSSYYWDDYDDAIRHHRLLL